MEKILEIRKEFWVGIDNGGKRHDLKTLRSGAPLPMAFRLRRF